MSEQDISNRVESFFRNVETDPKSDVPRHLNGFYSPARVELEKVHEELGDEGYNKFAEFVAKDERINSHLPGLAIVALSPQTNMFSTFVDRDYNKSVSEPEIKLAAADSFKFDPIHRKALQYAADNFDKLRALNPKDGDIIGNNSELTTSDIHVAKINFANYRERRMALRDMRIVLENFDAVDSNGSGKITASEFKKWTGDKGLKLSVLAGPQLTGRVLGGTEELSKSEYAERLAQYERNLNDISAQLGLK